MNLKIMKRLASISLAAMMAGCVVGNPEVLNIAANQTAITASALDGIGTCGQYLSWRVDGDTLTIGGKGEMRDYSPTKAPWYKFASQIKKLILTSDITIIGDYAFYGMDHLEYIYTKNEKTGSQYPVMPNVTEIGKYAFAECKALRGNTESGSFTLGDSGAASKSLFVGDSAFQNCEQVRILKCNFKSITIDGWGFYHMDSLRTVDFSNTLAEIRQYAFRYSKNLSSVSLKPSSKVINKYAFQGTAYETKGTTSASGFNRNAGSATTLSGKQLVVNFFVDRTHINLTEPDRAVEFRKSSGLTVGSDEIATDLPARYDSNTTSVGVFKKNKLTSQYLYGWDTVHTEELNGLKTAVELNNYDYTKCADKKKIPLNTVQNGKSYGNYGKNNAYTALHGTYVTSDTIQRRLKDVDDAMKDLKSQAAEYGGSFSYIMKPETNFHITYDSFSWKTTRAQFMGNDFGYDITNGYGGGDGYIYEINAYNGGKTGIGESKDYVLWQCIKSASQGLTGEYAQPIDLDLHEGSLVSNYTNYLKGRYGVDNVVYLVHINEESQSFAMPVVTESQTNRVDEFAVVCSRSGYSNAAFTAEHEIAHLYGALDYYEKSDALSKAAKQVVENNFERMELMQCKSGTRISAPTAFSIGWLPRLDTPMYKLFFQK